jgi:hypothetical protein
MEKRAQGPFDEQGIRRQDGRQVGGVGVAVERERGPDEAREESLSQAGDRRRADHGERFAAHEGERRPRGEDGGQRHEIESSEMRETGGDPTDHHGDGQHQQAGHQGGGQAPGEPSALCGGGLAKLVPDLGDHRRGRRPSPNR